MRTLRPFGFLLATATLFTVLAALPANARAEYVICDPNFTYLDLCLHYPQTMPSEPTTTTVKMRWLPVQTLADRTEIRRNGTVVAAAAESSGQVTISGLQPDTPYTYELCNIYNAPNNVKLTYCNPSLWTARTSASTTPPPPPPPRPTGLEVNPMSWNTNSVRWNTGTNLKRVRVSRPGRTVDLEANAFHYEDTGLSPGTVVTYDVCFVNDAGQSCAQVSGRTLTVANIITGDFTGDGKTDVALVGAGNHRNVPIARSRGDGGFDVLNTSFEPFTMWEFAAWATTDGVRAVAGDFNGDGKADIALVGGAGWRNIKVALSVGDGSFTIYDRPMMSIGSTDDDRFAGWTRVPGVQLTAGDFNGDGRDDLALAGGAGWGSMPVALSLGTTGTFYLRNDAQPWFPVWATQPGATLLAGNFGGQGDAFALAGGTAWGSVPYGAPTADGSYSTPLTFHTLYNKVVTRFPQRAANARLAAGDLDGNGVTDIAAVSLADDYLTVLLSDGVGYHYSGQVGFQSWDVAVEDWYLGAFGAWAKQAGAKLLPGDFDGDGLGDLALLGPAGWNTLPVAFARHSYECPVGGPCNSGWMQVTNQAVADFAGRAVQDDRPR